MAQPKLLDFGIAKVLRADGEHRSLKGTATGQRLLTPRYASPEQVRGAAITTATEVARPRRRVALDGPKG